MAQAQTLSDLITKLRSDIELLKRELPRPEEQAREERIEELLESIDEGLNAAIQELLRLREAGLVRVRVLVDTVPTEYSVAKYSFREVEDRENGGKRYEEVRTFANPKAAALLATAKKVWEEVRNRLVLGEVLPGVYLIDPEKESELRAKWQEIIVDTVNFVVKEHGVLPRTKASLQIYDIWMRRSDLRRLLEDAIAKLRAKQRALEERLAEVKPRTRKKYRYLIAQIESKILKLQKLMGEL